MFNILKSLNRTKLKINLFSSTYLLTKYSSDINANIRTKLWKVVFYGTDEISEATLKALDSNRNSSVCDRVVGELDVICIKADCAVHRYATKAHLPIHYWPYELPVNVYDVGFVVSFGHMIPSESIHACKYGIINAHPSLLPRWRGAAPIIHTILNDDQETGVTITQVSPNKFDVGNVLLQEKYNVPPGCTAKELTKVMSGMAADMVIRTLKNLTHYIEVSYPQSKEGATYARKLKPSHGHLNWKQDSSVLIFQKYKAFDGFIELYTYWKDMKVVLLTFAKMEDVESANVSNLVPPSAGPGFCFFHKRRKILFVKCQDGWCGILSMKIPKRGKITAQDFYNGFISKEEANNSYFHEGDNKDINK